MKTLPIVLLRFGSAAGSLAQTEDPAKMLFESAVRCEESGKAQTARVILLTLANIYTDSPLAARAKTEIDAISVFQEAEEKRNTGHRRAASLLFRVVADVYPESPLAKQAVAASEALEPAK